MVLLSLIAVFGAVMLVGDQPRERRPLLQVRPSQQALR
jgi:hypothetical protein